MQSDEHYRARSIELLQYGPPPIHAVRDSASYKLVDEAAGGLVLGISGYSRIPFEEVVNIFRCALGSAYALGYEAGVKSRSIEFVVAEEGD